MYLSLQEHNKSRVSLPSSIDILSTAPVPASGSAGVELGTAQPQLVYAVILNILNIGLLDFFGEVIFNFV